LVQSMQNQKRSDWSNTYLQLVAIKQQTARAIVGSGASLLFCIVPVQLR